MKFLDTNILLRYFTRDDERKAVACFALLQRVQQGQEEVTTSEVILTEVAYVLSSRSHYNLRPADISARLRPIVALRGLKLPHKRSFLRALDLFASHPFLDFEDALTVAHMERLGITEILSYDTDFDRIPTVKRLEPDPEQEAE